MAAVNSPDSGNILFNTYRFIDFIREKRGIGDLYNA